MDWAPTTTRTIDLGYEQLLTFTGRPGTRVRVLYGSMWLTEEGYEQDVFVCCGDEVRLQSGGKSVIEALGAARVQVIEPATRPIFAPFAKAARRVWRGLRSRIGLRDVFARFVLMLLAVAVSAAVLSIATPGVIDTIGSVVETRAGAEHQVGGAASVLHDLASARIVFLAVN